jgi:phosphoglycolate phosphatase-like HAD superfamily hydrolase
MHAMRSPDDACVLFDLDGVLVDSRVAITGCINYALAEHGLPVRSTESLHRFIGPPLAIGFAEFTGQPPDSEFVASCLDSYRARYSESSLRDTVVTPGIEAVLSDLAQLYRLAVATSKPLVFAEPLLGALGLRSYFAAVAGPDLSVQGESKADTMAAALEMLGHPKRVVMVGDRSHDVVGARAHSLPCVGVTWGIGSIEELREAGAGSIVDAPAELPASVKRLLGNASPLTTDLGSSGNSLDTVDPLTSQDSSLAELVEAVRSLDYGRPSDRSVEGMLREKRGTCSTKHLFLAEALAERFPGTQPQIVHRVYRLDRDRAMEMFGTEVAAVVPCAGVVDVHRYLTATVKGQRIAIDATFPGAAWDGRSSMPLSCGSGQDHPAGSDPDEEKRRLEAEYCDPDIREPFIAALARSSDPELRMRP